MKNLIVMNEDVVNEFNFKLDSILSQLENKQETQKEWLSANEAMQILGIKQTTLWSYRKEGKLTFTKVNKKVYFLKKDILKLLNQNKVIGFNLKSA
jgi:hypothetical protein